MTVDLDDLQCFVAVAEERHFGRAADRVGRPVSTLSRIISDLERRLKADLLLRSRSGTALTNRGIQVLGAARAILLEYDRLISSAGEADGPTTDRTPPLTLAVPSHLPPRWGQVAAESLAAVGPGRVMPRVVVCAPDAVNSLVAEQAVDVALGCPPPAGDGARWLPLLEPRLVVIGTGRLLGAADRAISASALDPRRLVFWPDSVGLTCMRWLAVEKGTAPVTEVPDVAEAATLIALEGYATVELHPSYGGSAALFRTAPFETRALGGLPVRPRLGVVATGHAVTSEHLRSLARAFDMLAQRQVDTG